MKVVYGLLFVFFFYTISCKEDKQGYNKDDIFKVLVNLRVKEKDEFHLFYIQNANDGRYKEEKKVTYPIVGTSDFQTIEFVLPQGVLPKKFRIDVGENKNNTIIEIREVKLIFNQNEIIINDRVFNRFFKPNVYLERAQKGFMRRAIKGRYDPFFMSTALLNKKIQIDFKDYQ
jgi:hypothetical protein